MNVKGFTRVRKFTLFVLLALLMLPGCIQAWGTSVLSVATDGESYGPGERVEIFGVADPDLEVAILVLDSNMTELYEYNATTDEDGEFSTEYYLQEDAMNGTYLVKANSGGLEAEKTFEVVGEDVDENAGEEETPDPGSGPGQEPTTNSTDDGMGEPQAEEETSAEDGDGLASSIERAENYLEKLRALIESLADEYSENQTVIDRLDRIRELLDLNEEVDGAQYFLEMASDAYGEGDYKAAAKAKASARNLIGRAKGLLSSVFKTHKVAKFEEFTEHVDSRISGLEEKLLIIQIRLEIGPEIASALNETKMKLGKIKGLLASGNIDDLIDDIDDVVDGIDTNIDEIDGNGTSVMIKSMNRLEAKIRVYRATLDRLARKGKDTSEMEEQLADSEALLEEMMNQLGSGDQGDLDDLLSSAGGNLNGVGDKIKGYMKPKKN